jgi:tripartite-type tricarboxylate transporter receptor subunit TctC
MRRLQHAIIGTVFTLALATGPAAAQYPTRPITLVVPFAAGGPTDVVARLVGEHMSRTLGQTIVVENLGGGGGTIGMTRAAQANPDGYTIAIGNMGTQSASPALHPKLKYDPSRGFTQISIVNHTPQSIVTKKDVAAKNLGELMAHLKANRCPIRVPLPH